MAAVQRQAGAVAMNLNRKRCSGNTTGQYSSVVLRQPKIACICDLKFCSVQECTICVLQEWKVIARSGLLSRKMTIAIDKTQQSSVLFLPLRKEIAPFSRWQAAFDAAAESVCEKEGGTKKPICQTETWSS